MEELEIKLREMLLRIEDLEGLVSEAISSIRGLQVGDVVEVVGLRSGLFEAATVYIGKTFVVREISGDSVLLDNNYWFSKNALKKINHVGQEQG